MSSNLPILHTPRLTLRPLVLEDAEVVRRKAGRREVADTTLAIPHPYPKGAAADWIRSLAQPIAQGHSAVFGICDRETGELIGACGLGIRKEHRSAEIGYWLEIERWGQGIMSEAVAEVIRFAFEDLELDKVYAYHMVRNPASGRVMQKVGMQQEGLRRKHVIKWDTREDVMDYGLLREDWLAGR